MNYRHLCLFFALLFFVFSTDGFAQKVSNGEIKLDAGKLQNGSSVDLSGSWFYRPDYAVKGGEKIESSVISKDDFAVGVPQFLNPVRWWLDDSENFKKSEAARMKKLGFATDRAEEGWYKLSIDSGKLPADKRVFIEFDGVAMKSKVFLNGQELGNHTGMFSRFQFDLTPHLKTGKNLLAVWVSMEKIPVSTVSLGTAVTVNLTASKVLSLSKGMFGPLTPVDDNRAYDLHGIWQPVRLTVRGAAKLEDVYFVPTLSGAKVHVEARGLGTNQRAVVKARWIDPQTNKLFAQAKPQTFQLNSAVSNATLEIDNLKPRHWTPADPNLYKLEVTLESERGEILDKFAQKVGFRTFEARGNKLFLNGNPYWLRGTNQLPYGKNPWDAALARKLIQAMHDNNQRVTRTHATPWNEAWLDAADEIGLGVSIEGIRPWAFVGKIGATPKDLFEHWLMENADVVKRIRNHPSVLIWTIGNEMLLRDNENPEKWKQLSDVVKQTRELDPTRPTVVSSSYQREPELYSKVIEPHKIDDGDIDDIHSYKGWYADSPFVTDSKFEKELAKSKWNRPFIGQEMSTGYPDLDTGLPVFTYTKNQRSPQSWVGVHSYPGSDPEIFLEHNRAVTKRWAEQLRFERADKTAGFILFSAECWFEGSFDEARVKPYPVVEAVKYAFAPVGLALETAQRRFYAGDAIKTSVFVTNDDEQFRDLQNLSLETFFVDQNGKQISSNKSGNLADLKYYATAKVPVEIKIPQTENARTKLSLVTKLRQENREISRTVDLVEVFRRPAADKLQTSAVNLSLGAEMSKLVEERFQSVSRNAAPDSVVFVGEGAALDELKPGGKLYSAASEGSTVIVFSPGAKLQEIFPDDVMSVRKVSGEYADWTPATGTKLAQNLEPMDLKWWARTNDWRVMVASEAHRLNPSGKARELVRFVPAHGYIALDRVPEFMATTLFEIPVGKGRVWVCDFDLEESIAADPAARIFAENLLAAAADPDSTRVLVKMPAHEEMLTGKKVSP
ncbi:MAG: lacZ 5 [Acidobacteria bacterium]|nr:lacZ 5 [Acidobacteriota bacterium]